MTRKRKPKRKIYVSRLIILCLAGLFAVELIALGIEFIWFSLHKEEPEEVEPVEEIYIPTPTPDPRRRHAYSYENLTITDGILSYEDDQYTSELVIDVSAHQSSINWQAAVQDGVEAVMIRAGYRGYETGEIHEDDRFAENMTNALNAGLEVGVYFFTQAIDEAEACEEAEFVLSLIKDYDVSGPIAIDMELSSDHDRINDLTVNEKTAIVKAFAGTIRKAGYEAMVYGSASWLMTDYHLEELQDICSVWVANYSTKEMPFAFEFEMWQYNAGGFVYGIDTNVDLNIRMIPKN